MDSSLLTTKLRIPPRTHHLVRRDRLVDALERGVPDYRLILISAPAGYGKTTLLSQWARTSRFPVAWLSLGVEDNDPERFFRYLLTAWEAVQPDVRESRLGVLLGAMSPDIDAVLAAFVNTANDVPDQTIFVLDDYHLIDDAAIHEAVAFLLDHLPSTVHLLLAGRGEPPLPLARYRARHELLDLGTEDLRFSEEETGEFLIRLMALDLAADEIAPLHDQLEGWIAGLQLVSLTLRRRRETAAQHPISGRHRFIVDYLSQDVLADLPDDVRRFLLQTSLLDRLSGPLCDAVTGRDGSQEMLELLERENLFLVPLDDDRAWFRYHRLFADVLREELGRRHPEEVADLHRRAARWSLAHHLAEEAFHHAVAGNDPDLVMEIGEHYFDLKLLSGEFTALRRWIESLPEQWSADYPLIGLFYAGVLIFTGAVDAGSRCIDEVEQRLALAERKDGHWHLARVHAVRCAIACFQNDLARAEAYADSALQDLPAADHVFRAAIYHALGDTYRRNGRWQDARDRYLTVLGIVDTPSFRIRSVHVHCALADLALEQGRLRDSAASWRKALSIMQEREIWGSLPLPLTGWVFIRMGEILYEWNDLADAWDHLARGLERAELGGDVRALIAGCVIAARLQLTSGDTETAAEYLERARPLVEQSPFPDWTGRFERCRLELWLARDRLRAAVNWADALAEDDSSGDAPEGWHAHLALARVLIVKGDGPARDNALVLLDRLLPAAEAEGRAGVLIEALALQALVHWQGGERVGAMTALERSLRLAEPEGYVRLFADLGRPMSRLLQDARSRGVMPDYVDSLLAACGADLAVATGTERLPEPLSDREQDVLHLLAAGLTNREIADKLTISPETVKKHSASIYDKLGVGNRTEAAAKARALDLLG